MKKKFIFILPFLLLSSCQSGPSSSFPVLSSTPSSTSSESASTSSLPEETEKPDRSCLIHASELDDLKKTDWKGKYIWFSQKNPKDTYVAFRKTFTLPSLPKKALLSLTGDSKITLFVNGKMALIDASLKRGATLFDAYYQEIDITDYLKTGTNVLAFEVCYFGRGGNASIDSGHGGLLFDLIGDGSLLCCSDNSVKAKRLTSYKNESMLRENYPNHPMNSFLAEHDIYFDARESVDFYKSDFDDSSWEKAVILGSSGYLPFGDTYLSDVPPFDFDDEIKDMTLLSGTLDEKTTQKTTFTFALEENMQFLPFFEITAPEGSHVSFYTNTKDTQNLESFYDDYIAREGRQSYLQYYWRSGYEFILNVDKGVTVHRAGYIRTRYHSQKTGVFTSDEERLNTLYQKSMNTLDICMRDSYMDCPERERSPYSGDGANQIAETMYALDEDGFRLAKKAYLSLLGFVKEDHVIPSRSPSSVLNEIPMQNLAFLVTARSYYLQSGDDETMKKVFPVFVNYLKLFDMTSDGLVEYRDGTFPWIDWGENSDSIVMENAWYAYALKEMLALGKELSILKTEEENFLKGRYESIKNVFYDSFFVKNVGFCSLNGQTRHTIEERGNALAVLAGLVKEEDYPLMKKVLTENTYASPYMERFVLEALSEMNYLEEARIRMLNRYERMISLPISTLWETWSEKSQDGTINHGWSGGPLVVLAKYFAGIRSLKKGYDEYQIKPYAGFSSLESQVYTKKGNIRYTLEKKDGLTTILLDTIDAKGTLILDESFGSNILLDGQKTDSNTIEIHKKGHYTIQIS